MKLRLTAWSCPVFPAVFSAGENLDETIENSKEAIALHIDGLLNDGVIAPDLSSIERFRKLPEFRNMVGAVVEIDPAILDDRPERVTITLPRRVFAGPGSPFRNSEPIIASGDRRHNGIVRKILISR